MLLRVRVVMTERHAMISGVSCILFSIYMIDFEKVDSKLTAAHNEV